MGYVMLNTCQAEAINAANPDSQEVKLYTYTFQGRIILADEQRALYMINV